VSTREAVNPADERASLWDPSFEAVCRKHADLVAVYESRGGVWGLLLRHTMVPLPDERRQWREATRRTARAVMDDLRAAGLTGRFVIVQWCSLGEAVRILRAWRRRYDGDPERRRELVRVVERYLADQLFVATSRAGGLPQFSARAPQRSGHHHWDALINWYRDMAPSWLAVEPKLRRHLVFATHRWLVDRVFGPVPPDGALPLHDLTREGALGRALAEVLPPDDRETWRPWIRLLLADLRRALSWPPAARDERWARWLFLIPYSIPVPHGTSSTVP
jgi:hypothetical protein